MEKTSRTQSFFATCGYRGQRTAEGRPYNGIEEVVGSIPSGSTTNPSKSSKLSALSADSPPKLTDFEALTFDCYGTLIDWEAGMIEALKPQTSQAARPLTRNDILEAH